MDYNRLISNQAAQLFDLDPLSWNLLEKITKQPENIYSLNRKIEGSSRPAIKTRFDGSVRFVGLEKETFIIPIRRIMHHDNKKIFAKYYYLEFKGFLASLKFMRFSSHPLVAYLTESLKMRGYEELNDFLIEYAQTEIALWFQTHIDNGISLTRLKVPHLFYYKTKNIETTFGNIRSASEHVMPQLIDNPVVREALELGRWDKTYSDDWFRLIGRKHKLKDKIPDKFRYNSIVTEIQDRWFILMLQEGIKKYTEGVA
ncbi:MAG: hypothetical protein NTV61_04135 [Candidatus Bathyarchaeota archaeon]|nr:hypothetical protein [Candidatus Bathyarchaeota archaeon]